MWHLRPVQNPNSLQSNSHARTHTFGLPRSRRGTGPDNFTKQDNRPNYRAAWGQSRTLMKVQFPLPQVSAQRDCICETITLSQSKEAAFKWSVKALGGANNHSSLSHCVTEVLNPPFVLHITCLSIDCLVLHFRHLDGHAFKWGGRGPRGMRALSRYPATSGTDSPPFFLSENSRELDLSIKSLLFSLVFL